MGLARSWDCGCPTHNFDERAGSLIGHSVLEKTNIFIFLIMSRGGRSVRSINWESASLHWSWTFSLRIKRQVTPVAHNCRLGAFWRAPKANWVPAVSYFTPVWVPFKLELNKIALCLWASFIARGSLALSMALSFSTTDIYKYISPLPLPFALQDFS